MVMTDGASPSPTEPPRRRVAVTQLTGAGSGRDGSTAFAARPGSTALRVPGIRGGIGRIRAHSWVVELSIFLVLALLYTIVRASFVGSEATAVVHAHQIIDLQGPLLEAMESSLNSWLMSVPAFAVTACYFYALMHYAATPVVFIVSRRRGGRQYWRGYIALVVASGIAVLVYAIYPVAPPRLVPDLGIVDVMRAFSRYGWWGDAASAPRGIGDATNQYAAMPSMHCGWALWCGIQMWGFGTATWRRLAVLYPSAVAVVVVATGNHFVLDIVGGALCVLVGYAVATVIGRHLDRRAVPLTPQLVR